MAMLVFKNVSVMNELNPTSTKFAEHQTWRRKLYRILLDVNTTHFSIFKMNTLARGVASAKIELERFYLPPALCSVWDLVRCDPQVRQDLSNSSSVHAAVGSYICLTTSVHVHLAHWQRARTHNRVQRELFYRWGLSCLPNTGGGHRVWPLFSM